jgi:cytoskeleton protein RodZ
VEEIGRRLRAAREAKGLSLEVVEEETKIRRKYIEALEAGHGSDLPGDAYLKGFLRTYGNYLGLDGTTLVEEYKQRRLHPAEEVPMARPSPRTDRATMASAGTAAPTHAPARPAGAQSRIPQTQQRVVAQRPRSGALRTVDSGVPRSVRRGLTVLVGVALVGAIGYYGWQVIIGLSKPAVKEPPPAPPAETTQQKPTEPAPPPQVPDLPKVVMTQGAGGNLLFAVPAAQVELTINAAQRLWMRVYVDGKEVKEETFTGLREYKGALIKLDLGHLTGVTLTVNGQAFDKFPEGGPFFATFGKQ